MLVGVDSASIADVGLIEDILSLMFDLKALSFELTSLEIIDLLTEVEL